MEPDLLASVGEMLHGAQSVVLISHLRPDTDAVGSMLGLGLTLEAAGKQVQMVLADGLPRHFHYLPGAERIVRKPEKDFDLVVVLDSSDLPRTGNLLGERIPDLNIDHHVTNLNFARVNFIIPTAAATSQILAEFMPQWGFQFSPATASALLAGVVSDTLGFRTSNVTPGTLRVAASLMEAGAELAPLYYRSLVQRSFEGVRYWGFGLANMQRYDRLVYTVLTLADRQAAAYPGNDDDDLINVLSAIDGCDVSLIMVEQKNNRTKVSWRCMPGWDVSKLAVQFGGGGHPAAAGAEISGALEQVKEIVLQTTLQFIEEYQQTMNANNSLGSQ